MMEYHLYFFKERGRECESFGGLRGEGQRES